MYGRVENGIVRVYQNIPKEWVFTTTGAQVEDQDGDLYVPFTQGASTGNFSDMPSWIHKAEGFLPLIIENETYNSATHTRDEGQYTVGADSITLTYTLTSIPSEELAIKAAAALVTAKTQKQTAVTSLRDSKVLSGFEHEGVRYDTKEDSLRNINGMMARVLATDSFPVGFPGWIAEDNTITQMTIAEFKTFAIAASDFVATLYAVGRAHKDAIDALETLAEVNEYDIEAGW